MARFGPSRRIRLGRPRGVLDWTLVIGAAIAFVGAGPSRGRVRLPFYGLFGDLPLGVPRLAWLGIAIVLYATWVLLQRSRGNFTIVDDDDTTITLGLSEAENQNPAEREKARQA